MQKQNIRRALIGCALAAAAISTSAYAHDRRSGEERGERMVEKFARELNLTDAQEAQVEKIFSDFFAQRQSGRDEARARFAKVWSRPNLTAAQIEAAMEETKQRRKEARAQAAEKIAALHGVLNPDQRERAFAKFGHFSAMFASGRGRMFVGGHGRSGDRHGRYGRDRDEHHGRGWFGRLRERFDDDHHDRDRGWGGHHDEHHDEHHGRRREYHN